MTDEKLPDTPELPEPRIDDEPDFGRTMLQFFVIPAVVVAFAVGVFFFFAWLVSDEKTGVDYLNEIRAGSANRRWQAAFELSKIITMDSEKRRMEGLVPEMVTAFEQAENDDERVRQYLALSLGHLGDPAASPVLIEALADDDAATRLYSSWALGNIGDTRAVPGRFIERRERRRRGRAENGGLRAGGHRRRGGAMPEASSGAVRIRLRDVSWNAAISLAQMGDELG